MNILNTQYNKSNYNALVASGLLVLTLILNQFFHITLGDSLVSAIQGFLGYLIVVLVPNADTPAPKP